MEETKYMNPYLAGVLLGLLLIATIYITGRGLGASGAIKSYAVTVVETDCTITYGNQQNFIRNMVNEHAGKSINELACF